MGHHVEAGSSFGKLAPATRATVPCIQQINRAVGLVRPLLVRNDRPLMGIDGNDCSRPDHRIEGAVFSADDGLAVAVPLGMNVAGNESRVLWNVGRHSAQGEKGLRSFVEAAL